jgi:hypothetical protein
MPQASKAELRPLRFGRLTRLQCIIAGAFAVLAGSAATVQFCFGLARYGGLEYAPRVTVISSVRVLGPATSASAMLVALLIWTHQLDADVIRKALVRAAPRVLLAALISVPVTTALAVSSSLLVANWVYDISWHAIASSRAVLRLGDVPAAIEVFVVCAGLTGTLCWFALPVLKRRAWSLVGKLGAAWVAAIVARIVARLVCGS